MRLLVPSATQPFISCSSKLSGSLNNGKIVGLSKLIAFILVEDHIREEAFDHAVAKADDHEQFEQNVL